MRYGAPWWLVALLWVPIAAAALTLPLTLLCVRAWLRRSWSVPVRVLFAATTLAALAFIWFVWEWNLLGPHL